MSESISQNALSTVWSRLNPSHIVRGEGSFVFDSSGARYLDFTSGIGVTSTGHCHPKIVAAVQEQAGQLLFGQMNCMLPEQTIRYANALKNVTPDSIDCFFFGNSGSEAVEGAIKLARTATRRTNVIAFEGGFHGRTSLTMALTSSKGVYRAGYQPLPSGIAISPYPYVFRYGWDEAQTVEFCLEQLERVLKTQSMPDETAAILLEPVLGEGGYVPAPFDFVKELRRICDETGILLILDEIQTGFGRTGRMWACERSQVTPDILTMAKGIASGLPMSAIGASPELMAKWKPGSHGGTYGGGSAVGMAAALATLEVIESEKLLENADQQGQYLCDRLKTILTDCPDPKDVRGAGLMIGVELGSGKSAKATLVKRIQQECFQRGLMLLTCGAENNVIRFIPPLNVSREEIDTALETFERSVRVAMSD